MKIFLILILIISLVSCTHQSRQKSKVLIIKQWHLSPSTNTRDVNASKALPQFENQSEIYNFLVNKVSREKITLISEGCENGQIINENFPLTFNGWNMISLMENTTQDFYPIIMTSLPMKLKAKFPDKILAICGDSEDLIQKNQLALSDAKGFLGFYLRLKQNKKNQLVFDSYHKALIESQKYPITDPITYSKDHAANSISDFKRYINERNKIFIQAIKDNINKNPVLIIGGLHVKDLAAELKREGIEADVLTPKGYPESSEGIVDQLIKELY